MCSSFPHPHTLVSTLPLVFWDLLNWTKISFLCLSTALRSSALLSGAVVVKFGVGVGVGNTVDPVVAGGCTWRWWKRGFPGRVSITSILLSVGIDWFTYIYTPSEYDWEVYDKSVLYWERCSNSDWVHSHLSTVVDTWNAGEHCAVISYVCNCILVNFPQHNTILSFSWLYTTVNN